MNMKILNKNSGIALPEEDNKPKRGDLQQVHSQVESVGTSSRGTKNKRISLQHSKLGRHRTLRLHPNSKFHKRVLTIKETSQKCNKKN